MEYRILGKTGLKISRMGFGGIPIQRIDAEGTKALMHKLLENGVNYIDTARGYTVSEEYLGIGLEGIREHFVLATKSMSRTAEAMAKDIDISLKNLRTDYIDLYQIHIVRPLDGIRLGELDALLAQINSKESRNRNAMVIQHLLIFESLFPAGLLDKQVHAFKAILLHGTEVFLQIAIFEYDGAGSGIGSNSTSQFHHASLSRLKSRIFCSATAATASAAAGKIFRG